MCARCVCPYCNAAQPILVASIGTQDWGVEELVCETCGARYEQGFMMPVAAN